MASTNSAVEWEEARKAEGPTLTASLIPRPPNFTGRVACTQAELLRASRVLATLPRISRRQSSYDSSGNRGQSGECTSVSGEQNSCARHHGLITSANVSPAVSGPPPFLTTQTTRMSHHPQETPPSEPGHVVRVEHLGEQQVGSHT